ncbi:MAG: excinuclease ABC subunit UvrA [Metamycoplasmataceae bacterium]
MNYDGKDYIIIKGARENNLKHVDLVIPKNKLVVFTGLSGSGKSSLAFNTIYEEGRRRYIDSLSSYARQFLGGTKKPDVDSIEGLSPAISIEQKTTHNNPRSTVGTITEIYDYLRLLFARLGKPFCPKHNIEISSQNLKDILDSVMKHEEGSKLMILSPILSNAKGENQKLIEKLKREGFLRIKVNDELLNLDDEISLPKNKRYDLEIVVDRIVLSNDTRDRVSEAIVIALEYSKGLVNVEIVGKPKETYSQLYSCIHKDFEMPIIEPKLFSFNSPSGMCQTCKGIGLMLRPDIDLLIPNKALSINQGAIEFSGFAPSDGLDWQEFDALLKHYKINKNTPIEDLSIEDLEIIKYGSTEEISYSLISRTNTYKKFNTIEGLFTKLDRRYLDTTSDDVREYYRKKMSEIRCHTCKGMRLNQYALAVKISGININDFVNFSIDEAIEKLTSFEFTEIEQKISISILNELSNRLTFLSDVGLDYLTLNRTAETLSGGEAQRIRLATQIGSKLVGVLYVLDEPSIGLHQSDNDKLIKTLKHMVEIGNTLIVVEHDEETITSADFIVDIGPLAGNEGGEIIGAGTLQEIMDNKNSITGKYLSKELQIVTPKSRRSGNGKVLEILGVNENNLRDIDVKFPLGKLIAVTGVSGSGKSTLINQVLIKALKKELTRNYHIKQDHYRKITGIHNIDKIVKVSQSPIGRTPRSNPATYTSVFDDIRTVFTSVELARARGYEKGRFSFNVKGGRCEKCSGDGSIKIEMHFLPDVYVVCDYCEGKRYNLETLEVKYKGKNIADVLDMSVKEALEFFISKPKIRDKLKILQEVGLGYIKLGQNATTLSGGEAQRIKLSTHLQKTATGKTVYILDEPTTGLHTYDIQNLLNILNRIVDKGDTVIVIEHSLDIVKCSDYIIDLGPGGGNKGGKVVVTGTPEQVIKNKDSLTGRYLKKVMDSEK